MASGLLTKECGACEDLPVTKTVFPTLTSYYGSKRSNEPIIVQNEYTQPALSAGKHLWYVIVGQPLWLAENAAWDFLPSHYSLNQSGYRSDTWPCFVSKAEIAENSEEPENEEENEKNSKSSSSTKFRLVGILVHSGQASGGHYYSYVLQRYTSSPFCVILQYFTRRLPLKPTRTLT